MQNNTPITENTLSSDGILGDNMKLLILQKAFNEITSEDNEKREEEEKK